LGTLSVSGYAGCIDGYRVIDFHYVKVQEEQYMELASRCTYMEKLRGSAISLFLYGSYRRDAGGGATWPIYRNCPKGGQSTFRSGQER
jgi:hypothetical protein